MKLYDPTILPATVDFETKGILQRPQYPPLPVGAAVEVPGETPYYLSWGHPIENNCTFKEAKKDLKSIYRKLPIIYHNAKFDMDVGKEHMGLWPEKGYHDTMILAFLYNPHSTSLSLKPLAEKLLDMPPDEQDELREWIITNIPEAKKKKSTWGAYISEAPGKLVGKYAKGDVLRTGLNGLFTFFYKWAVDNDCIEAYQRELILIPILLEMECKGISVATSRLKKDIKHYESGMEQLDTMIRRYLKAPKSLDIDKDNDFADVLHSAGKVDKFIYTAPTNRHPQGQRSVSKDNLKAVINDDYLLHMLNVRSKIATSVRTFMGPWYETAKNSGGKIYTSWNSVRSSNERKKGMKGARTGRFCISHGSDIMIPGDTKKIEDIKKGDLVYTYDDKLSLRLKKVLWSGCTGIKEVIRIHWIGQGNHHNGVLDLTPNHEVRLVCGEYKKAKDLLLNDRVLALHREVNVHGYNRLYVTGYGDVRENRFVFNEVFGYLPEHVHHKDSIKTNDNPSNLEGMTHSKHTSYHSKKLWREGKMSNSIKVGEDHYMYRRVTVAELKKAIEDNKGSSVNACKSIGLDYETFQIKSRELKFDYKEFCRGWNRRGQELTKNFIISGREVQSLRGQDCALKFIGLGYYRWIEVQKYYGFLPCKMIPRDNHRICKIEILDTSVDVYDLEIEDTHNFISNEICVHNSSSPNLQNVPGEVEMPDKATKKVEAIYNLLPVMRKYIIPDEGRIFIGRDFCQKELRVMGHFEDGPLLEAYKKTPEMDVHIYAQKMINKMLKSNFSKKIVKNISFGLIYGMGIPLLAKTLGVDEATAKILKKAYLAIFPGLGDLIKELKSRGRHELPLRTWGSRLYFCEEPKIIKGKMRTFEYKLLNYLIQGSSADIMKETLIQCYNAGLDIRLTVHDELLANAGLKTYRDEMHTMLECMENIELDVQLLSDGAYSKKSWGQMIKFKDIR